MGLAQAISTFALLVWCGWCYLAYYVAVCRSRGEALLPSIYDWPEARRVQFAALVSRQQDPPLERLRRRALFSFGAWVAYVVLGPWIWSSLNILLAGVP